MSLQRSKRRDDAVDKIRTINWFRCIGDHLDIYIPREIQRFLQPGKTGTGVNSIRNNRYLEYSEGKHVPRPDLVEHADRLVDGSSWELNHVLWSVLRCSGPIHGKEHKWIRELSGDIPTLVIEANNVIRLRGDRHYLGSFERRASLDSLTALTILLRMNHERQDFEQVWECAKSIFRLLLMIGNDLNERCIGGLMFDLYAERVFYLARYNGNRIYAEKFNYPAMSRVLYELAEHLREKNSHTKDRKSKNHYLMRILNSVQIGEFFQPLIGPDLDIGPPTKADSEWLSIRNAETAEY